MGSMRAFIYVAPWLLVVPTVLALACSSSGNGPSTSDGGSSGGSSSGSSSSGGKGASSSSGSGSSSSGSSSSSGGVSASSSSSGGSGGGTTTVDASTGPLVTYGTPYTGGIYNLGPVDYAETAFHNACAPGTKYDPRVQAVEGTLLAGLWNGIPNVANYCDACIYVTTAKGKTGLLRVVTYGDTTTNSIDTSTEAYTLLSDNENPRDMSWVFAECPDTGPMLYEFQTESSEYWTSLWVRNARVPLAKVEVESVNHATWTELTRGTDGTLTDNSGFGNGAFSIRSTGIDGSQVIDEFAWPSAGVGSAFLTGAGNFK
jgi:expansin (peptidoglycan-binding protein)